jgi:hypothetical protein
MKLRLLLSLLVLTMVLPRMVLAQAEVLALSKVTVDSTAGGKTLTQLGLTLDPGARRVSLQAVNGTIYVSQTLAATNSFEIMPTGAITLKVLALTAAKLKFYAAANVKMNILQLGE